MFINEMKKWNRKFLYIYVYVQIRVKCVKNVWLIDFFKFHDASCKIVELNRLWRNLRRDSSLTGPSLIH